MIMYKVRRVIDAIKFKYKVHKRKTASIDEYPQFVMDDWITQGGEPFDLSNPVTYCQKIQWSKIYENTPIKGRLSDKAEVRSWIQEKIGSEYLVPVYGIYDSPDEINFSSLPDKYVIKMNHSSHMNIIVKDNKSLNRSKVIAQLKRWMQENFAFNWMELQYKDIKPRIIIEKYIEDSQGNLDDYKFLCFNGKVFCVYVMKDRTSSSGLTMAILDRDYNLLPYSRKGIKMMNHTPEKPSKYDEMVRVAEILSKDFSHVRVDLYNLDGVIYFGEMTFTSACGYGFYDQVEFDKLLGKQWKI